MKINKILPAALLAALFPFNVYPAGTASLKQLTDAAGGAGRSSSAFEALPARARVQAAAPAAASSDLSLAELAAELSKDPGAIDDLIEVLAGKDGYLSGSLASPESRAALAAALKGADKEFLDRFPVLTPKELLATAAAYASRQPALSEEPVPAEQTLVLSGEPKTPRPDEFLKPIGHGLLYGDEDQPADGAAYGDSIEVSKALDRLADNDPAAPRFSLRYAGKDFSSVSGFLEELLAEGVSISAADRRYFANFGDLRYEVNGLRREVRTPIYVDTGLKLAGGRTLVLPVTHSELDIYLRGKVNADLTFFFGMDGLTSFRTNAASNMRWVGGRTVKTYTGAAAAALLERAARMHREMKAKAAGLPQGGYGPLGDCNDVNAFVTGRPAYPMTRSPELFSGGTEIDAVSNALPYDLISPPAPAVIFDSLPFEKISAIPFPEVRKDLSELRAH